MTDTSSMCGRTDKRHIYLTGFMGTGKSSVGKKVAEALQLPFCDLDENIVAAAGRPIVDIFAADGETAFRDLEHESLLRLAPEQGLVVATGGGVVIRSDNRALMRKSGVIINLTATLDTICKRVGDDASRPLLNADRSVEKIRSMLAEREGFYADADVRIETDGKRMDDVCSEILVWLKNWCHNE